MYFILSSPKTLSTIRMNNLTYEILSCNGKIICYLFLLQQRNKYDVEEKIDQDIANLISIMEIEIDNV